MLVLSRNQNERIRITHAGEELDVVVVEVGGRVRLGFEGPQSFKVLRGELVDPRPAMADAQPPAPQSTEGVS